MLRLLGRTVAQLWAKKPKDAYAIHLHHIDPGYDPIRQEIVTKLGQRQFLPALRSDVAAADGEQPALAQQMDASAYVGLPPYGSYVARSVFFHSLAFNDQLKGATVERVRYSVLSPSTDISFIDAARMGIVQNSAYLDDRPNVPLRFQAEANLTQIIRRQEEQVDPTEVRTQLNDRIREIFAGKKTFEPVPFAGGPSEVPDDAGNGRPYLVIVGYDAADVAADAVQIPDLVDRIFRTTGASGELRGNRNNLVFVLAEAARKEEMKRKMKRHLALKDLLTPARLQELADHQQEKMRELARRSEQELALTIQQCYRHVLYPTRNRVEGATIDIGHAALEVHTASQTPGDGQKPVIQVLRESKKLRLPEDDPDSPSYIRDRTPLKKGQMTTAALRAEFRRDVALPMLVGDEVFIRGIRQGVESGEFVYKNGDLIWAKGLPAASLKIDEQSIVFTAAYAKDEGIWPRPERKPDLTPSTGAGTTGTSTGDTATGATGDGGSGIRSGGTGPGKGFSEDGSTFKTTEDDTTVFAEGPLKEALAALWDKARGKKLGKIGTLVLKLFDAADGFRVMGIANTIPKATKTARIAGGYETTANARFEMEFEGPVQDAQPVKDFLEPQLRAAKEKDVELVLTLAFADGLDLAGDEPDKLAERLGKFGSGAAYVTATAKA